MAILGELESAVMNILWTQEKPLRTREVHDILSGQRELAYTTVMTVMDRLAKKGVLTREQTGGDRAWLYSPAHGRADFVADALTKVLGAAGPDRVEALRLFSAGLTADERRALVE